jgi:hypothetical protein
MPTLRVEMNVSGGDEEVDRENHDDDDDIYDLGESEEESEDDDDTEIVETFILTFHNGDFDAEFNDALRFDRGTPLLDRPTQTSYIKPNNWRERNRIGLEKMKEQLQTCIYKVSHGHSLNLHFTHNYGTPHQLMDSEEPIVWHEPVLDECWDEIEAKLYEQKQQEIVKMINGIHIANVEITKERMAALVDICSIGRTTDSNFDVTFNNTNLCGEGIAWLLKLADVIVGLRCFYLRHNRIDSMELARCFSRSLKSHTLIQ